MKKILVPTDFSRPSQTALKYARLFADKTGAEINLLHIVQLLQGESFNVEGHASGARDWMDRLAAKKLIEQGRIRLEQTAQQLRESGLAVRTNLRLGDPLHGIRSIVEKRPADLIIMGTHGRAGLGKGLHGSVTQEVIRYSKSPVLSVHAQSAVTDCRSIVYATSLRKDEKAFAKTVTEMQRIFDATIHLLHINIPGEFYSDQVVKKQMNDFVKRLRIRNCIINIFNDYSREEGILSFAAGINADLIAMATHKRSGLSHFLLGSGIAEDVAQGASKPVLTLSV